MTVESFVRCDNLKWFWNFSPPMLPKLYLLLHCVVVSYPSYLLLGHMESKTCVCKATQWVRCCDTLVSS